MGKTAVVLGGTSPHIDLINKLKKKGYYVILADYLEEPIAAPYADEHARISTLDYDEVLDFCKERSVDLVISSCVDQANVTACYVAEKLGLTKPYSHETALQVTNKKLMKKIFADNDIPTAKYYTLTDISELQTDALNYPLVVKPADCNSSKGVTKVNNDEELRSCTENALKLSRTSTAVIEEFVDGDEIHIDCYIRDGKAQVLLTKQKKKAERIAGMSMNHYGSIIPAMLNNEQYEQAAEIAQKIADAFHLENTPMFYQAIINDSGIYVLEFAPRIGGGLGSFLLDRIAGVDIIEASIDSYLEKAADVSPVKPGNVFSTNLIYVEAGNYGHVEGLQELKDNDEAIEVFTYQNPGEYIDGDMKSGNRIASYILQAENYDSLRELEARANTGIKVFDINGVEMKRK